jgi:hypothetical protein
MTRDRFGLFPFRSPLLRESLLLSLPVGTEMFHFPTLPPPALCVQAGAMGHYAPSGFPIRKSPDRSLVADSPGLIAGSYVLHRLLVPRHPPCALTNLAKYKYGCDARVHCAVLKVRAVPAAAARIGRATGPGRGGRQRPFPQDPTACSASKSLTDRVPSHRGGRTNGRELTRGPNNQCSTSELPPRDIHPGYGSGRHRRSRWRQVLLRKEVIQPHLPVRLPCYDFVPIASPTFDGSLPYGLGHRLRVLPTFVT